MPQRRWSQGSLNVIDLQAALALMIVAASEATAPSKRCSLSHVVPSRVKPSVCACDRESFAHVVPWPCKTPGRASSIVDDPLLMLSCTIRTILILSLQQGSVLCTGLLKQSDFLKLC